MTADLYFKNKFIEWQEKGNGDYKAYIRKVGKYGIKTEFLSDGEIFKQEVCSYLNTYAKNQEKQGILSIIQGIVSPDKDIIEIIVGATLEACGISDTGNALIGLALLALIGMALISLLSSD